MRHRFPFFALILFLCGCVTGPSSVPKAGPVNTAVLPTNKNNKPGPKIQTPSKSTNSGNPIEYPEVLGVDDIVVHEGYTSSYNHETLCPNWVAYELTVEEANGKMKGKESFQWDPQLKGRQSNREDYKNDQQWDKGHLAPKADMKWSVKAYEESFFLTNICPQNRAFNGGIWLSTEKLARRSAEKYGKVYIVSGPIFTERKFGTLGTSRVAIPDKFYKALLIPKGDTYSAIAFVLDNAPGNSSLKTSSMSVDSLETLIGRDLFHNLDDEIELIVESKVWYVDWSL